jgi:hypothetical protein
MRKFAVMLASVWLAMAGTTVAQQPVAPARDANTSTADEANAKDESDQAKQARKERREHRKAINHRHRRKH